MNDRIKELLNEATSGLEPDLSLQRTVTLNEMQKFAELIVRECMLQVEEQYKPVLEDKEFLTDTHWDGYVQCGVDSYVAIREHFYGVEE
jgi:hypothetical protein